MIRIGNSAELESNQIWNRIKDILQGNEIPNRPQSFQSVEFGEISQKGIVQTLVDVFGATKSKHHGEGRKYVFDIGKLDRLGKFYESDIDIQVTKEKEIGTHGTLVGLDQHIHENENGTHGTHGTHGTLVGQGGYADNVLNDPSLILSNQDNINNFDKDKKNNNLNYYNYINR